MNKRLTRIAPVKAGVVLGVLYALLACIMVPFMMLAGAAVSAAASQAGASAMPFGFLFGIGALFLPVLYGVMGFIGGLIAAAVYNLVAKWTGGVEITLADIA
jgi:sulfite exporter TauE/SafE